MGVAQETSPPAAAGLRLTPLILLTPALLLGDPLLSQGLRVGAVPGWG